MSNRETAASEAIDEFNEEEKKDRALASGRYAFTPVVVEDGITLGIAVENEPGYYRTNYHSVPTWREAVDWANAINDRRLTRSEALKIVLSSVFPPERRSIVGIARR